MLGKDRFASFETPNVIDPGDDAPLQPKRKQQSSSSSSSSRPIAAPPSYRPVGVGRSEKIDFNGSSNNNSSPRLLNNIDDLQLQGYNNYHGNDEDKKTPSTSEDEDDDERSEDASSSQADASIERARNYAATLLKDANRRTSADVMGAEEPSNGPAGSSRLVLMGDHDGEYGSSSKHLVRNQVLTMAAKAMAVIGLLILVVLFVLRVAS